MDVASQKRGKNVAIGGLIMQMLLAAAMLVIWRCTWSLTAMAATWMLSGGLMMWLMAMVLFYCRQLQRQEALELEEIAGRAEAGSIFERDSEAGLHVAANRLRWVMRWLVPGFTLIFAAFHATIAFLMLRYLASPHLELDATPQKTLIVTAVVSLAAMFLGFLLSRYATGMGRSDSYRPMRAVGSYLVICVLAGVSAAVAVGFAYWDNIRVDLALAYAVVGIQVVLAAELAMNFILDIYRPRVPGHEARLAFDSRVLGLIAEPGRVGHSIAEAMNYQFGFEVSKTWFYQLLSRAMLPMLVVAVVILLALSSIVLVPQGQTGVVLHLGKVVSEIGPGAHLKWPWPIDRVDRFDTQAVHEILLGTGEARTKEERARNFINGRQINLWAEEHGMRKEVDFLVGMRPWQKTDSSESAKPVNIIKLEVAVQYRIKDARKFGYSYDNADEMLRAAAQRQMIGYLASATLQEKVSDDPKVPQAIMSWGSENAARELQARIKQAVEDDLGVEIMNVAIVAAHPPAEAAEAYEKVQKTQLECQKMLYEGQAQANRILSQVAGSPATGLKLAFACNRTMKLDSIALATGAERVARAKVALTEATTEMAALQKDIERDRQLGKVDAGVSVASSRPAEKREGLPDKQRLLQEYQQYIGQLGQIIDDPKFDVAEAAAIASAAADDLLEAATGKPATEVAQARAQRWDAELRERARSESFQRELAAFLISPNIYMEDRYMEVWDQVLPGMTKFVLAVDPSRIELRLNMQKQNEPMQGLLGTPK